MMDGNNSAILFKSIINLAEDLTESFGDASTPLKLFYKNLEQITFTQKDKIEYNNSLFKEFVVSNSSGILSRNFAVFQTTCVSQTEKAFIDFDYIFKIASDECKHYIWAHLLTILAIADPASQAKNNLNIFQQGAAKNDVLGNVIKKIEKEITDSPTDNPVELISKIMQSGTFADIMADLTRSAENGEIDLASLASSVGLSLPGIGQK
jgi:hypothetical protein